MDVLLTALALEVCGLGFLVYSTSGTKEAHAKKCRHHELGVTLKHLAQDQGLKVCFSGKVDEAFYYSRRKEIWLYPEFAASDSAYGPAIFAHELGHAQSKDFGRTFNTLKGLVWFFQVPLILLSPLWSLFLPLLWVIYLALAFVLVWTLYDEAKASGWALAHLETLNVPDLMPGFRRILWRAYCSYIATSLIASGVMISWLNKYQ